MRRIFLAMVTALVAEVWAVPVLAAADQGPPYTESQFFALNERRPGIQGPSITAWWSIQPDYLRTRILAHDRKYWWPIILCNYQGYQQNQRENGPLNACERNAFENAERGRDWWTADGQFKGPSAECRATRDRYGVPMC